MSGQAELFSALAAAQAEMPELTKDAAVDTGKFSYNYLSLDSLIGQIRPVLGAHGIAVAQSPIITDTGHFALQTVVAHVAGGSLTFDMPLPVPDGADAKSWGSWITYFRRYGLLSVLFLAPGDDDDGAQGSGAGTAGTATAPETESGRVASSPSTEPQARPDENPLEPTAQQHAKLNAMLAELEEKNPNPGPGNMKWLDVCKQEVLEKYGKKSRTQLTRVEMTELIDTVQRWGYEQGIPF